jgi:AAA-like domain
MWKIFVRDWASRNYTVSSLILSEPLTEEENNVILRMFPNFGEDKSHEDACDGFMCLRTFKDHCREIYEKCDLSGNGSKDALRRGLNNAYRESSYIDRQDDKVGNTNSILGLEFPEGVVPLNSKFYMDLDNILEQCQQTIIHPSALLRIQAPRQMGKTSLLARIVDYAEGLDYRIAKVDLQCADLSILQNLDSLLQWLCQEVCDQLDLEIVVAENWKNGGGSIRACMKFFQEHLLRDIDRPLLLSLDNLERIFENPTVGDDFSSCLRSQHESGQNNIVWSQLRIIILHTWYIKSKTIHNSPFNVGRVIRLPELTTDGVQELVNLHGLDWDNLQTQQLTELVGFHPFLIRFALYHVAIGETSLAAILERGHLADSLFNNHLQRYWRYLERYPELREIMAQIVKSENPSIIIRSTLIEQLQDAGLVKLDGDLVLPANQLYRLYFRNRL